MLRKLEKQAAADRAAQAQAKHETSQARAARATARAVAAQARAKDSEERQVKEEIRKATIAATQAPRGAVLPETPWTPIRSPRTAPSVVAAHSAPVAGRFQRATAATMGAGAGKASSADRGPDHRADPEGGVYHARRRGVVWRRSMADAGRVAGKDAPHRIGLKCVSKGRFLRTPKNKKSPLSRHDLAGSESGDFLRTRKQTANGSFADLQFASDGTP